MVRDYFLLERITMIRNKNHTVIWYTTGVIHHFPKNWICDFWGIHTQSVIQDKAIYTALLRQWTKGLIRSDLGRGPNQSTSWANKWRWGGWWWFVCAALGSSCRQWSTGRCSSRSRRVSSHFLFARCRHPSGGECGRVQVSPSGRLHSSPQWSWGRTGRPRNRWLWHRASSTCRSSRPTARPSERSRTFYAPVLSPFL